MPGNDEKPPTIEYSRGTVQPPVARQRLSAMSCASLAALLAVVGVGIGVYHITQAFSFQPRVYKHGHGPPGGIQFEFSIDLSPLVALAPFALNALAVVGIAVFFAKLFGRSEEDRERDREQETGTTGRRTTSTSGNR